MTATEALISYGFRSTDKGLVFTGPFGQKRTRYVPVDGGGFNRFEWEDGVWRQYPLCVHADWEGIGGLAFDAKNAAMDPNSKLKPECFEWTWPEAELVKVYAPE